MHNVWAVRAESRFATGDSEFSAAIQGVAHLRDARSGDRADLAPHLQHRYRRHPACSTLAHAHRQLSVDEVSSRHSVYASGFWASAPVHVQMTGRTGALLFAFSGAIDIYRTWGMIALIPRVHVALTKR